MGELLRSTILFIQCESRRVLLATFADLQADTSSTIRGVFNAIKPRRPPSSLTTHNPPANPTISIPPHPPS